MPGRHSHETERRNKGNHQKENKTMTRISHYLSGITLNVSGLSSTMKSHRLAEWMKKQNSVISCVKETHLIQEEIHSLKTKGWKNIPCRNSGKSRISYANFRESRF